MLKRESGVYEDAKNDRGRDSRIKEAASKSLLAILHKEYNQGQINELVGVCHSLALPYIRRRLSADVVLRRMLDLNMSDFTYDCIADLFAFADSGDFPHFDAYFAAYPLERLSREEMLAHLRRLVFSHVNQGIFRLYNEVDPSLGKIIRNIKLALQQFHILTTLERFGVPCLAPSDGDLSLQNRSMDPEELEAGLRMYLHGNENIPFMLGRLALFLQESADISRVVSLTSVAIVFRSLYARQAGKEELDTVGEEVIESPYLEDLIREAVNKTRRKMAGEYIMKKNIRPALLDTYFTVIEKKLLLTFSGDGHEKGLRELLSEQLTGMTDSEYRTKHRSRLEYLSRLTGEEVARRLRS